MNSTTKKIEDIFIILTIILVGVLFLAYFKIKHSMTFINLDELLWMYRSRSFMDNIFKFDFSNLIQSSQPGIMVMWTAGPFMKIIDYDFNSIYKFIENLNNSGAPYNIINENNPQLYSNYKEISFLFNIPMLGIIFSFIFSLYYLLKKLELARPAIIFSLLLIVTTPYYIYFTTPTDKLVGIFSTLGFLSLLVCASKRGGRKFLLLSAVFCSWAALTKLSALFLVFFSLFVLAFYKINLSEFHFLLSTVFYNKLLRNRHSKPTCHPELVSGSSSNTGLTNFKFFKQALGKVKAICSYIQKIPKQVRNDEKHIFKKQILNKIKDIIKDYMCWVVIFFLTSVIFLPAIITNPDSVWRLFAKESSQRSIAQSSDIFLFFKIAAAYFSDSFLISFNLFAIAIFVAFLFLLFENAKKKIPVNKTAAALFSYVFFFFIFITLFSKTYSFRYLIPVLIVFQIIAGIGMYEFANIISKRAKFLKKNEIYFWIITLILVSQGLLIYYSEIQKIENLPVF